MSSLLDPHPDFEFVDATHNDLRTPAGLRAWRLAHGLTQTQLGDLLEVAWNSVNRWENGHRKISRVVELALRWLELELRNGTTTPPPVKPVELTDADQLVVTLVRERDYGGADHPVSLDDINAFRESQDEYLVDAAAAGDKRAMIRLRKDCGLPAFR